MTCLLEPLQHDCFAHHRIGDGRGKSLDDRSGSTLGVEHLLPEWDGAQSPEGGFVEIRPSQGVGVVPTVARDKLAAETLLMVVGSDLHDGVPAEAGGRIKRRAKRNSRGTKLGRNRRES